jgi:hypothetical protein
MDPDFAKCNRTKCKLEYPQQNIVFIFCRLGI